MQNVSAHKMVVAGKMADGLYMQTKDSRPCIHTIKAVAIKQGFRWASA